VERLWKGPECNNGIRSWSIEKQLHLRKGRKKENRPEYCRKEKTPATTGNYGKR
jgi:hypothetical protein